MIETSFFFFLLLFPPLSSPFIPLSPQEGVWVWVFFSFFVNVYKEEKKLKHSCVDFFFPQKLFI